MAVVELNFAGGVTGARIGRWVRRWELVVDTGVGFVRGCQAEILGEARSRDSLAGAVMGSVGSLRPEYCWWARK